MLFLLLLLLLLSISLSLSLSLSLPPTPPTISPTAPHSRIEVKHQGQWGTVCGTGTDGTNSFTESDAKVACRAMGFEGGRPRYMFGHDFFRESISNSPIWIAKAQCQV